MIFELRKVEILFAKIKNRNDALLLLRSSVIALYVYLGITALIGTYLYQAQTDHAVIFYMHSALHMRTKGSFAIFLIGWLWVLALVVLIDRFKSRVAAIFLFAYLAFGIVIALYIAWSFFNILSGILIIWVSFRALAATFELHARFALNGKGGGSNVI